MHIRSIHLEGFRRFSDLTIANVPATARLVVLAGPNGTGKSSIFDAFRIWHQYQVQTGVHRDSLYHPKTGSPTMNELDLQRRVAIEFHEEIPIDPHLRKKIFYVRSAYRHEADFTLNRLERTPSPLDRPPVQKLIDIDKSVSLNYQELVQQTIDGVYSERDDYTVGELRERLIGPVRESMLTVFGDLRLQSPGRPLEEGSFLFEKGTSLGFHYKNLSGGEKAAFDLLLDLVLKRDAFDDTVFCIDEPEAHLNTRVQGSLLEEIVRLVPEGSQLWVATHSIGMMAKAHQLHENEPGAVVFLDFGDQDFDHPVTVAPVAIGRDFWRRSLDVALGDLAALVAPRRVVLCEGRPASTGAPNKAEFDAHCYRTIFAGEHPEVAFLSVGGQSEVTEDRLGVVAAIETLVSGTRVTRVVDRDDRALAEIIELQRRGVQVLSRRNLESYLLDDEVLDQLCKSVGQPNKLPEVLEAKQRAIKEEVLDRGQPADDLKPAKGVFYVAVRRLLHLTGHGNTADAFLRHTLAPLIAPGTDVYSELKRDVLGD